MLRKATEILGYTILAQDGEIGHVEDFYFDTNDVGDPEWTVRYMVVDTGFWIFGTKRLIAPEALGTPDWDNKLMPVDMTQDQVKNSPEHNLDRPVTREYEEELRGYYGWPIYWGVPSMMPMGTTPTRHAPEAHMATNVETGRQVGPDREDVPKEVGKAMRNSEGAQLHSVDDFTGFSLQANDGDIGSVSDVFIDDYDWHIRYLLIDTGDWLSGREVLIAPEWIEMLDLDNSTLKVDMTQKQIEDSPEYESGGPLNREFEGQLYNYYGYRTYW